MDAPRVRRYRDSADLPEILLPAGDVTEGVVRVGDTVRRPHQEQSFAVAAFLDHLEGVGFDGSPRFLGVDDRGRDVLTFLEGRTAGPVLEEWVLDDALLVSVARFARRLQRASEGYDDSAEPFPPRPIAQDPPDLVCHRDITPQNVVVRGSEVVGVVDFDLAGPSTRMIDSINAAMHWVPLGDPSDLAGNQQGLDQLARLRLFAEAFGWTADEREALPDIAASSADLSWERMRHNAETVGGGWARMWRAGVGDRIRRRAAWLRAEAPAIRQALRAESQGVSATHP